MPYPVKVSDINKNVLQAYLAMNSNDLDVKVELSYDGIIVSGDSVEYAKNFKEKNEYTTSTIEVVNKVLSFDGDKQECKNLNMDIDQMLKWLLAEGYIDECGHDKSSTEYRMKTAYINTPKLIFKK